MLKNGKGYIKEYDIFNGDSKYEGEYLNGERNGKRKRILLFKLHKI